jgi:hypothetical protein
MPWSGRFGGKDNGCFEVTAIEASLDCQHFVTQSEHTASCIDILRQHRHGIED